MFENKVTKKYFDVRGRKWREAGENFIRGAS